MKEFEDIDYATEVSNDDGFESSDEEEREFEKFPDKFRIDYRIYETTLREIISWNDDNDINLDVDYQRGIVWDNKRNSRFIESILLKLPIPGIIIVKIDSNKFEILDGKQRLTALFNFVNYEPNVKSFFKLGPKVPKYANKTFSKLSDNDKKTILRTKIPVTQIDFENTSRKAIYATFERVNTGGLTLSSQNIRNAIYKSNFLQKTTEKANALFRDKPRFTKKSLALGYDVELLLRIISTYVVYKNSLKFPTSTKRLINDFVEILVDDDNENFDKNIFLPFKTSNTLFEFDVILDNLVRYIEITKETLIESKSSKKISNLFWEAFFVCLLDLKMDFNQFKDKHTNILNNVLKQEIDRGEDSNWYNHTNNHSKIVGRIKEMYAWIKNSNSL